MRYIFAALMLICTLTPAQAQDAGVRRYFDDWLAVCRADGYCSAISYVNPNPGDGRVADHWFRVGRHAEETYWELSFTPIVVMADSTAPFSFAVDGVAETFAGFDEIAPYGAVNDFFLLGKKAQLVMDRLMPGTTLDISFTDEAGSAVAATISLEGLTAALIWIDERQGRLGSERVAEVPPQGLAPAFDLQPQPVLDLTTVRLMTVHNETSGCSIRIDEKNYDRVWPVALDQSHTLYVVPCEDFAYNFIGALYVESNAGIAAAPLPQSDAATGNLGNTVYSVTWDEVSGTLSSLHKGGNGNCGSQGTWQWLDDHFDLIELRARETCDQSSEEWPVVARGTTN